MSTQENTKKVTQCSCPTSRGKDVIVITIETCKKACEAALKKTSEIPESPSSSKLEEEPVKPAAEKEEETDVTVLTPPKEGGEPAVESDDSVPAIPEKQEKSRRVYKLPILIDRHHGPGCAMELCVLEKHEDTCRYKKEDVEGRTIDDRVGSYECIGRMVFRTCEPTDLESESSGITGNFTGLSPTDFIKAGAGEKVESQPIPKTAQSQPTQSTKPETSSQDQGSTKS